MGILHRVFAHHAPGVFRAETGLLHALDLVRRPVAVQWVVTRACDLHCAHCYTDAGRRGRDELTTDEAKRLVVDELVAMGRPTLVLSGGELLLRRDIGEIVAYAASRGVRWAMHTHGLHVPRFRALFEAHPPAMAAVSLDGTAAQHDGLRGKAGSHEAALEAMRVLREAGCDDVVAGTTVTRDNADHLADLFSIVERSAAHSWGLHLFAPEGRGERHRALLPTPAQLRRVAAYARALRRTFAVELCNEWGSAGDDDLLYREQPFLCGAGRVSLVVSAEGEVLPCTTADAIDSEGNVRDAPLRQLWARGFSRFRRADGCFDERECYLQARHDVQCHAHAFGPVPPREVPYAVRALEQARPARLGGVEPSPLLSRALHATAVAAVFAQACVARARDDLSTAPQPSASASPPDAAPPPGPQPSALPSPAASQSAAPPARLPAVPTDAPPLVDAPPFPAALSAGLERHHEARRRGSPWSRVVAALRSTSPGPALREVLADVHPDARYRLPDQLARALEAHASRLESGQPSTPGQLIAVLDAAEAAPVYDVGLVAHLHRLARRAPGPSSPPRAALFRRLAVHLAVVAALAEAERVTGPVEHHAWRKKSAPPPGFRESLVVPPGMLDAARRAYASGAVGRYPAEATVRVSFADRSLVALSRYGAAAPVDGREVLLGRLDLLRAKAATSVTVAGAFEVQLPAGAELSSFDLERLLSVQQRAQIAAQVDGAAGGDAAALSALEAQLPLAREALAARVAKGSAGALPMLLFRADE